LSSRQVISLTTDFGLADHFVGVMKGVILSINPQVELIDVSHEISSYDVLDGAFTLAASYRYFPAGTIHVVVVDPGVGSVRRPILVCTGIATFVAPDNGVLSAVYEREERVEVRHITREHYFLQPVSNTFHGRDVFAPVAAWLSRGVVPANFGDPIADYVKVPLPKPQRVDERRLRGTVLKIDKFGNVITSVSPEHVPELFKADSTPFKIVVNGREVSRLCASYASGRPMELFAIVGSSGFIEIGVNQASAAQVLQVERGAEVDLILG